MKKLRTALLLAGTTLFALTSCGEMSDEQIEEALKNIDSEKALSEVNSLAMTMVMKKDGKVTVDARFEADKSENNFYFYSIAKEEDGEEGSIYYKDGETYKVVHWDGEEEDSAEVESGEEILNHIESAIDDYLFMTPTFEDIAKIILAAHKVSDALGGLDLSADTSKVEYSISSTVGGYKVVVKDSEDSGATTIEFNKDGLLTKFEAKSDKEEVKIQAKYNVSVSHKKSFK